MRDVWTFGIQQPVRDLGLLCERLDQEAFTGDILSRIRSGIAQALLVIADLTGCNPNVFLEVGYAWGKISPRSYFAETEAIRAYRLMLAGSAASGMKMRHT